jgi:hypothetical protein
MSKPKWRPANPQEATSNVAAFIEFARATGLADLEPAEIAGFQAENPARFRALLARFVGLDPGSDLAALLAPYKSNPAMRARASWDGLLDSFAHYLLVEELRPDDTLAWDGAPDDPWPLGALLTGARVDFNSPG